MLFIKFDFMGTPVTSIFAGRINAYFQNKTY